MQILIFLSFVCLLVLSPNVLYLIGVGYMSPTASAFEKIHPSTYLVFLSAVALLLSANAKKVDSGLARSGIAMMAVAIGSLLFFSFNASRNGSGGGGEVSVLIVTFFSAGLFAYLLAGANEKTLSRLSWFLGAFLIANSVVGIWESFSGQRLLPYVISEEVIEWDTRPTAILGHPLVNAFVTGLWALALLMYGFRNSFKLRGICSILLHFLAIIVFGGRAALAATAVIVVIYIFGRGFSSIASGRRTRDAVLGMLLVYLLTIFIPLVLYAGVADGIINRFLDSQGSDETRSAALRMLSYLSFDEWIFGASASTRLSLQAWLGSLRGIELSWIALLMQFGLPVTVALLLSTLFLFRSSLKRGFERMLLLLFFFVTSFSSLSIASKSLLISQTLFIFVVYSWRLRQASVIAAPSEKLGTISTGRAGDSRVCVVERRAIFHLIAPPEKKSSMSPD